MADIEKPSTVEEELVNEQSIVRKLKTAFSSIGKEASLQALILFYTLKSPDTPAWCKTVVLGSLGYFISLIDGIPDLTPFLGYTDDIALMAATIATLSTHITPDIKKKAQSKQAQLFPTQNDSHKKRS